MWRKSNKLFLTLGVMLTVAMTVIICFTSVPNIYAADDDSGLAHNNLSFYNITSAAANYLSNAMAPGGDYNEDYKSAEFNSYFTGSSTGESTTAYIGKAGCFMGYNDKDLSSGISGWLSSSLSVSSDTSSTEAFPETAPFGRNPFANYIRFGNLLNVLGLDSTRSHTHTGFVRLVGGGIMLVAFMLSSLVNTVFSFVLDLLVTLNPFRFINSIAIRGLEPYTDDDSVFGGLARLVTELYDKIDMLAWEAVIPITFGILIVSLLLSKKNDKGHRVLNYIKKIAFVVAGIPLLGSLYTVSLEGMAGGTNFNTLNYKAVMSTFFDFENWAKDGMYVDSLDSLHAIVGQNGESFDASSQCYAKLRRFCYVHNPGTSGTPLGLDIGFNDSIIDGNVDATGQDKIRTAMSLLTRYMLGDIYEPNDYEFLQKKQFMNVDVDESASLDSLSGAKKQLRMIIASADPEAYGKNAPRSEYSPLYSAHAASNILFNNGVGTMQSKNVVSTEHPEGDTLGARRVHFYGKMPPLAVYNYLASHFSRTGVTVYSAAKSSSNLVKRPHFSVNRIGTGLTGFAYWFNCFMMVFVSGMIGWFYALSILINVLKNSFNLIKTTPFAMLGSLKSIARTITIVVTMVLEMVMTMFSYLLIMEFMLSLESLSIGSSFATGLTGSAGLIVKELAVAFFFGVFGFMALRIRKTLVKGTSEAIENWLNTIIVGQPGTSAMNSPHAPGPLSRAGGAIANGVGMAAGAALAGRFMGADATGGSDDANGTRESSTDGVGGNPDADPRDAAAISEADARRISNQMGESLRGLPAGTGANTISGDSDVNIDGGDSTNIIDDSDVGMINGTTEDNGTDISDNDYDTDGVADVADNDYQNDIDAQTQRDMESLRDATGQAIVPHGGSIDSDGTVLDAHGNPVRNDDGSIRKVDADTTKKYGTMSAQTQRDMESLRDATGQAIVPRGGAIDADGTVLDAHGKPVRNADGSVRKVDDTMAKKYGTTAVQRATAKRTGKPLGESATGKTATTASNVAAARYELARAAHDNQEAAAKLASITGQPVYTPNQTSTNGDVGGTVTMPDGRQIRIPDDRRAVMTPDGDVAVDANGRPITETAVVSGFDGKPTRIPDGYQPVRDNDGYYKMNEDGTPVLHKSDALGRAVNVTGVSARYDAPVSTAQSIKATAASAGMAGSIKAVSASENAPAFAKAQIGDQAGNQVGVVQMSDGRNIPVGANQRVVCDANGKPQVDAAGNPIIEQASVSANGRQYVVPKGMEPVMDHTGQPVMGADNKPVFQKSTQIPMEPGTSGSSVSASYQAVASSNTTSKIDSKSAAGVLNHFSSIQTPLFTRAESGAQVGSVQMSDGRSIPVGENQRVARWGDGTVKIDGNGNPIIEQKSVTVGGRRYAVPSGMEPVLDANGRQVTGHDNKPVFQKSTQIPANNPGENRMKGAPNVSASYTSLKHAVPMKSNGFVTTSDGRVYPVPENQMPVMTSTGVPAVDGSGKPMLAYTSVRNKRGHAVPVPAGKQPVVNAAGVPQFDVQGEPVFRLDRSESRVANDPARAYKPSKAKLAQTVARMPVIPNARPVDIPQNQIQSAAQEVQSSLKALSTARTKADARSAVKHVYEQIDRSSMSALVKNMVVSSLIHEFAPDNLLGDAMRGAAADAAFVGQDYARKNYASQMDCISRVKPTRNRTKRAAKDPTLDNIYAAIASLDTATQHMLRSYDAEKRKRK